MTGQRAQEIEREIKEELAEAAYLTLHSRVKSMRKKRGNSTRNGPKEKSNGRVQPVVTTSGCYLNLSK